MGNGCSMTDVFSSPGGCAYRGIVALRSGPLRTGELAEAMGIPPRRVHAYMRWALDSRAVVMLERGGGRRATVWGLGPTPAVLDVEPVPVRIARAPVAASVFEWRP